MRVLCNRHRHIVLEVERGNRNVVYVELEATLEIRRLGLDAFDAEYNLYSLKSDGVSEYQPIDFARHYLSASMNNHTSSDEVTQLLAGIMSTSGEGTEHPVVVVKLTEAEPVVGLCLSRSDAIVVAMHLEGETFTLTGGDDLMDWAPEQVAAFRHRLDPSVKPTLSRAELGKGFSLTCEGVYKMAAAKKVVAKVVPKKAAAVAKERVAKKDGPVAKIHTYLKDNLGAIKNGSLSRKDVGTALEKLGVNKGTIGVQVGKWATAAGVEFKKPVKAEKPAKAAEAKKPAAKPVAGTKPAAKPALKVVAKPAVRRASPAVAGK